MEKARTKKRAVVGSKISKPKVIVVCGPTATGKSALAVELARRFGGEIVSADSRQVYRGLDIGTGKITGREMKGVAHHLLDVANPKQRFTVEAYKSMAQRKISEIAARRRLPIVCGGTGFYIQAVIDDLVLPDVEPNESLRKRLAKKSAEELFFMLKKIDPRRAHTIDPRNSRRLIRAIEIAHALGSVPKVRLAKKYSPFFIGIDLPDQELRNRIEKRLRERIKKGMFNEGRRLHRCGLLWRRMNELGLEYRVMAEFFQNRISRADAMEKLGAQIWQYARRQRTWFRRDRRIVWFTPTQKNAIAKRVKKFLK